MAAIENLDNYILSEFDPNFALSGGILFAKDNDESTASNPIYYVASQFARNTAAGYRRFPYMAVVENVTYLFTSAGVTSQNKFTLYCVEGLIIDSASGGGEGEGSGSGGGSGQFGVLDKDAAIHAMSAIIGLTPNPLSYKDSTVKLITEKAIAFSREFHRQSIYGPDGEDDQGNNGYIAIETLNGLSGITKFVFCTQYPAQGEEGAVHIKLRVRGEAEPEEEEGGNG